MLERGAFGVVVAFFSRFLTVCASALWEDRNALSSVYWNRRRSSCPYGRGCRARSR